MLPFHYSPPLQLPGRHHRMAAVDLDPAEKQNARPAEPSLGPDGPTCPDLVPPAGLSQRGVVRSVARGGYRALASPTPLRFVFSSKSRQAPANAATF